MLKKLTPSELKPIDDLQMPVDENVVDEGLEIANDELDIAELESSKESMEGQADELADDELQPASLFNSDAQAFLVSMIVHTIMILSLALIPIITQSTDYSVSITALPDAVEDELSAIEDYAISDVAEMEIGANSVAGSTMALGSAPTLSDVSSLPTPIADVPVVETPFRVSDQIKQPLGMVRSEVVIKGSTGDGTTGTDGAIDRITYEILRSMEERPTLVVWFFDQSGSLQRRREEIRERFDRIYEEVGIIRKSQELDGKKKAEDERLLTSIFAFGEKVSLLTPQPTAEINEIRSIIDSVETDPSGAEKVFSALYKAVEKYKSFRSSKTGHGPERNVLFIVVSDERGDDPQGLDATINQCRKYAIPVYVIGVPAPFGREFTYVKYVDPDPKFDQSPQWAQVDQGPESLLPERVKLGYRENYYEEPVMDSGFGPYALSRLTYETGGIYFTVHPNRQIGKRVRRDEIDPFASDLQYFFDPEVMTRYRPDYVSSEDYQRKVQESPLRQALVRAAQVSAIEALQVPSLRFLKRDEASLANELTAAQQQAARLEPQLASLAQLLLIAEPHRDKEISPRWLAGYDLALGTVLAHKVRAEAYNAMLAKAKRGMVFQNPKNNTWVLKPENEISVGSKLEKEAETAKKLLEAVTQRHKGTPWGLLATRELANPIGWKWVEDFTDFNPPPRRNANTDPAPVPMATPDDKARMLSPPPPKRPIPKL